MRPTEHASMHTRTARLRRHRNTSTAQPSDFVHELDGLPELYDLLEHIDHLRAQLDECRRGVDQLLDARDLALYECWRMFISTGGATAKHLEAFLPIYFSRQVMTAKVPRRGSLRLILTDKSS